MRLNTSGSAGISFIIIDHREGNPPGIQAKSPGTHHFI